MKEKNLEYQQLIEYLSKSKNINQLPKIDDITDFLLTKFDDIDVLLFYRGEGIKFTIKDSTNCELIYGYKSCILHTWYEKCDNDDGEYIYKIEDELFVCATCFTSLQAKPEILKKYNAFECTFDNEIDKLLFPKKWTDIDVRNWCRKQIISRKKLIKK